MTLRLTDPRSRQQAGGPRAQQQVARHGGARQPLLLPPQQRDGITTHCRHRAACKGVRQAADFRARSHLLQQRLCLLPCRRVSMLAQRDA